MTDARCAGVRSTALRWLLCEPVRRDQLRARAEPRSEVGLAVGDDMVGIEHEVPVGRIAHGRGQAHCRVALLDLRVPAPDVRRLMQHWSEPGGGSNTLDGLGVCGVRTSPASWIELYAPSTAMRWSTGILANDDTASSSSSVGSAYQQRIATIRTRTSLGPIEGDSVFPFRNDDRCDAHGSRVHLLQLGGVEPPDPRSGFGGLDRVCARSDGAARLPGGGGGPRRRYPAAFTLPGATAS
jgi:hypothetical protein